MTAKTEKDMLQKQQFEAYHSLRNLANHFGTVKDLLKIPEAGIEALYISGLECYNAGQYQEAWKYFCTANQLDGSNYKVTLAAAATLYLLKHYALSLQFYEMAAVNDPDNSIPLYYAAECCTKLGWTVDAAFFCDKALEAKGGGEEGAECRERAQLIKASLKSS